MLLGATLAVVTAVVTAAVDVLLRSGGAGDTGLLVIGVPTVVLLLVGARLLVRGGSVLPVLLPTAALTLVVGWLLFTGSRGVDAGYVLLARWVPAAGTAVVTALCAGLPAVRRWRVARQQGR